MLGSMPSRRRTQMTRSPLPTAVALFLDVDNTLTKGFIQEHYAKALGCADEYLAIEAEFQDGSIDAEAFGDRLIGLFRSKGFTEEVALEHASAMALQPWTHELLKLPLDIYLVSSGPSYFLKPLAARYGIPEDRVLCSRYEFDRDGLICRCAAVDSAEKSRYVGDVADRYSLTVGVGDHETQDGPFLTRCTIPILTTTSPMPGYLCMPKGTGFRVLMRLLGRLGVVAPVSRSRPSIFLGSTSEAGNIAKAIQQNLSSAGEPAIWMQGLFDASATTIEALESALEQFDFAILIVSPDDLVESRGETRRAPRDNVLFELGLFMGRLGRERCLIVQADDVQMKLPSDLAGVTTEAYDPDWAAREPRAALGASCTVMTKRIKELGFRSPRL
jgi:phosphoserine phosphatase